MATPPPFEGHSPEVVHALIRHYAQDMPHSAACSCALKDARRNYRMEFPRGAYPAHLRKKPKTRAQREASKKSKYVEEVR